MDSSSTPATVALEYIAAVGQKRFDRVTQLLHPEMEFHMPGRTLQGASQYLAALRRLAPILVRNDVKQTLVDGNDVCVVYDFVTDTEAGVVPSVEWLTVDEGRVRTVRLIFHKERWPAVLAELTRRATRAPS